MRIQGADLRNKNRVALQDAFPLSMPLLMYLEPTNICNIKCAFCPTGRPDLIKDVQRPQGVMSMDTFHKVVKDLQQFDGKVKVINFYKDGEPLANKNYLEMARELKASGVTEKMFVKTNGVLLTPEKVDKMVAAGFDMVGISVIAPHAEGYERVAGVKVDYDKFLSNIRNLYNKRTFTLYIKMADVNFSDSEKQKFLDDFEPISDFISVENLHGWSRTDLEDFTLGTHPDTFDGVPNVKRIVCAWPMYQMTVNWNGTVQPCNEDWSWVNIVGNINNSSLEDIWNGETFMNFRKMHLMGQRFKNKACGTCYQTMSQLDDIDKYRGIMLTRIQEGSTYNE